MSADPQASPEMRTLTAIALEGSGASLNRQGTKTMGLPMTIVRELTEADLPAIQDEDSKCVSISPFDPKAIRASHHLLAMVIAGGAGNSKASFVTGMAPSTISNLRKSPMFMELVAYYTDQKDAEFKEFHRQAAAIGMDALNIMHERMLDPEQVNKIAFKELRALAETLLDRTILPSKVNASPPAPVAPPVQIIQFIDSPHGAAPLQADPRIIEGTLSK